MIDIFEIMDTQKTIHINIEGEVSTDGLLYDIEFINELTSLLLDNQNDVEFKIFNVKEYRDTESVSLNHFGVYGSAYEPTVKTIEFTIDVKITNGLYNKFDEGIIDFIDFFTKGSITYPSKTTELFTIDPHEEYMSRPVTDSRVNVSALDYMYSWENDNNEWDIGSHPMLDRTHDADGDAMYASLFFADELQWDVGGRE